MALKPDDVDSRAGTIRVLHGKGDRSRVVGLDPGAMAVVDPSYVRKLLGRLAEKAGSEKAGQPSRASA
ncbi:MAG: hypothetical protein M3072_15820 [Candidatus Dormibacteraeota bacterium]|nr:hypothetical protein [Candidatus Dormibacteraeota bacterium]